MLRLMSFIPAVTCAVVVATSPAHSVAANSRKSLEAHMELARKTLALVEKTVRQPKLAAELQAIERRVNDALAKKVDDVKQLDDELRALRRRILFSHPALDFDRLLINKRHHDVPGHMCDQYLGRHARPAPGLAVITNWKEQPREKLLLTSELPVGMTYHPDLSFDGERVVFAHCADGDANQRAFYLWEASVDGSWARQITGTADDPMQGWKGRQTVVIEDFDPCYLPDGGIAFVSTRSQQYGRCHGSRYVPSYCLYRCEKDGSKIRRISLNEANEWNPSVLRDGRLVYCRWDYINRHDTRYQSLWVTRPDGTGTAHYYGNYSSVPCMITEARAIPGSHKTVATGTDHHGYTAGTIVTVDPHKGEDGPGPLLWVTPEISSPEGGLSGETLRAANPLPMQDAGDSRGRRKAASPFPITEELFFVSYTYKGQYAIFLIDTLGGRELIHSDSEWSCFNPIPVRATPKPPTLLSLIAGKESEETGRFFVQDVYQCSSPLEPGSIKSLRVNQIFPQLTRSKPNLSQVSNEILKQTLGTVPVARDGSVGFEAPANEPLQFQLLDENGMAVMTMRSLVYLMPGEEATCVGCHESRHNTPTSTSDLTKVHYHKLRKPAGPTYEGGFSFVRTVQPVLDRNCIGCHGLEKTEGGINLLGTLTGKFTQSYETLVRDRKLVKLAHRNQETGYSTAKDYFAHAGTLAGMLLAGHPDEEGQPRVQLERPDLERIVNWLDLNGQFYGNYSHNRIEKRKPSNQGETALRVAITRRFGTKLARQPYAALVNQAMPSESRILKAPLSERAGGWGQIDDNGWSNTKDASYRELADLVNASITPLSHTDIAGTCGRENGCRCGNCDIRLALEALGSKN
ncbi:MAG: hypothetical protein QGG09_20725 [Pirellulaceae bacterium]|nr:hypothetical protein [Pirellulaceae bacterium]HJN09880.1 hypothetical protein [Pirellulaceae bacterium]